MTNSWIRSQKEFCIKPILFAHDYEYRTPFLHPDKIYSECPPALSKKPALYKLVLKQAYSISLACLPRLPSALAECASLATAMEY